MATPWKSLDLGGSTFYTFLGCYRYFPGCQGESSYLGLVWMPTTPSLITHHWKYLNFLKWHVWYLFPTPDNSKIQIFVGPTHHFCGVKWSCKFNTWKSCWCEVRSFVVWSDHVSSTHEGTVGVKSEVAAGPEKCPDRGSLNVCVFTRMPP